MCLVWYVVKKDKKQVTKKVIQSIEGFKIKRRNSKNTRERTLRNDLKDLS